MKGYTIGDICAYVCSLEAEIADLKYENKQLRSEVRDHRKFLKEGFERDVSRSVDIVNRLIKKGESNENYE